MSAFLGPIHTWLYGKIRLQENMVSQILTLGKEELPELSNEIDSLYGKLPEGEISDIIDQSNIHGWLQEQVTKVEYRLAYSVKKMIAVDKDNLYQIQKVFFHIGNQWAKKEKLDTAGAFYKNLTDSLLDGMPCDHAYLVVSQDEDQVVFKRNACVHKKYWDEVGVDISVYYLLRAEFIQGLLTDSEFKFETIDEVTGKIVRKVMDSNESKIKETDGIALMVEEHTYIVRVLRVMRAAAEKVLKGEPIIYEDYDKMIDFVRNYADVHHHGKEEQFLFQEMVNHLGKMGDNLVTHGMLVEHDWGRLFIAELVAALNRVKEGDDSARLDVIANAVGYANHLDRHIKKEDDLVYVFAKNKLSEEVLQKVNQQTEKFEEEAEQKGVQNYYKNLVTELESRYIL